MRGEEVLRRDDPRHRYNRPSNDAGVVVELRALRGDLARSDARMEGLLRDLRSSGLMRGKLRSGTGQ